ncbi:butyrophilin-like protein 9 [Lampris incognitus]|uniref:butyrophilin-like protein 9 n=1 Tax=Lampris incognitus TaxID=2546036 RepID=UPI0024B50D17|nr:butyrophilin-like protein 9 [Lampris incognitus]
MMSLISGLFLKRIFVNNLFFFSVSIICLHPGHSDRGGAQSVIALLGEDVILPFTLNPPEDARKLTVEWSRDDLQPKYVHISQDGRDQYLQKNPWFKERTVLPVERLERGDVSLKLLQVKLHDEGAYRCTIHHMENGKAVIQLILGSVSYPVISLLGFNSSGLVLGCEAKGWYPGPEMFWQDSEGKSLSHQSPEPVRGPDRLYTISSTVTVGGTENNTFTCVVRQRTINETRETPIHVPADFFPSQCRRQFNEKFCLIGIGLLVFSLLVLSVPHCKKGLGWVTEYFPKKKRKDSQKKRQKSNRDQLEMKKTGDGTDTDVQAIHRE